MGIVKNYIKDTNIHKEKLDKEYRVIFDEIMVYFRTSALPEKEIEVTIQDILSSFLEAQEAGKTVDEVIGGSYKDFCENIIEELKSTPKDRKRIILSNISMLFLISIVLIATDYILYSIEDFVKDRTIIFNYSVSLDTILQVFIAVLVIYAFFKYVRSSGVTKKSTKAKLKEGAILYLASLIFISIQIGIKYFKLFNFEGIVLLNINIYIIIPILYIIMKIFDYFSNK
ncbi:DUF1048 domain-containing protein [Clostridium tunisiense]|uniref:DUF1048 domain-containing protein n=1 Tax=Clostridium tunisiense TaxID=219748 RepID=UPI0003059C77|nr:DUF1048 domain-containing protein [Clostridium tunisiense]